MFEFLFLDLDDTILDFQKAEHIALSKTLKEFGLEPTERVLKRYNLINKAHWEALERKELTREQVLVGRFQTLFAEMGSPWSRYRWQELTKTIFPSAIGFFPERRKP